jgi:hypothetical protein
MAEKDTKTDTAVADPPAQDNPPADQPAEQPAPPKPGEVVRTDGGITANKDILGGGIKETINIPVETAPKDRTRMQQLMIRAAKAKGTQKLAPLVGRPLDEWGLVGKDDEVRGHFILVDLDTLDKVEVIDYWKIDQDRVFANAQQLPKLLVMGDGLKQL